MTVILDFARQYQNASFPVHDETGTTLKRLLELITVPLGGEHFLRRP